MMIYAMEMKPTLLYTSFEYDGLYQKELWLMTTLYVW